MVFIMLLIMRQPGDDATLVSIARIFGGINSGELWVGVGEDESSLDQRRWGRCVGDRRRFHC